jgi:hypothetical protein
LAGRNGGPAAAETLIHEHYPIFGPEFVLRIDLGPKYALYSGGPD